MYNTVLDALGEGGEGGAPPWFLLLVKIMVPATHHGAWSLISDGPCASGPWQERPPARSVCPHVVVSQDPRLVHNSVTRQRRIGSPVLHK